MIFASRRLLRPSWIISHIFVVALLVSTVNLGFWQLRRFDERKANNAQIMETTGRESVAVNNLSIDKLDKTQSYTPATARGTFDEDRQVYLINRSRDGVPGVEVINSFTLETDPVSYVVVNRGYLPRKVFNEGESEIWKPSSKVLEIEGFIMIPFLDGKLQGDEINRIDIDLLSDEWGVSLLPIYLQQNQQTSNDWPVQMKPPELTEGSHLSYAVQWFIFTLIGLVGYPLVLRRVAADDRLVA
ncbi:MAG: SURF1 family protein [Acidimicrobiales bacterium]|nr:SURF1 family protein [Acidimicrobiales bacterium]